MKTGNNMTPMNADRSKGTPMNAECAWMIGVHQRLSAFIGVRYWGFK
jgi:hypothetical protein